MSDQTDELGAVTQTQPTTAPEDEGAIMTDTDHRHRHRS